MNGYRDDIISILKTNGLFHQESIGLVHDRKLFDYLLSRKLLVSYKVDELTNFDYVVLDKNHCSVRTFLSALSSIDLGGIIILQVTDKDSYDTKYANRAKGLRATKVHYPDHSYIVLHIGKDYGN